MTTPTTEPGTPLAPSPAPARARAAGDRFFSWTAGLGLIRSDGWLGGVAAGIATRLRIDALIVRGVLVVVGLFGFPVLFLYALAWALLPDLDGRIPLREAVHGRFTAALAGIAACAVLGLAPAPFALAIGAPALGLWSAGGSVGALGVLIGLACLAVVAVLLVIIVRAAILAARDTAPEKDQRVPFTAPETPASAAASGSGPDAAPADPSGMDAAGFAASVPAPAPTAATPGSDEYAAWREQHAAWKVQEDAWRREQQDAARVAREQARREKQMQATAFAAEAAERRRARRATNPRTPFAYVISVIGVAVAVGAGVALTVTTPLAGALGLFVAALVVALGMVIAAIARRRSGFLAAATVLLLAGGAGATAAPTLAALHVGEYGISNTERWPASAPFTQPWGSVYVTIDDLGGTPVPLHIDKASGWTSVNVMRGVALDVDITVPQGMLSVYDAQGWFGEASGLEATAAADGRQRYTGTIVSGPGPVGTTQRIVVDQHSGGVDIMIDTHTEESE